MQQRMEVHLYEFWDYGATKGGTVQKENLELAGNNTWAICVPNFCYPKKVSTLVQQTVIAHTLYFEVGPKPHT